MEQWLMALYRRLMHAVPSPPDDHDADIARRQEEMEVTLAALQARADLLQGRLERHIVGRSHDGQ
jgi:hypothetical protein